MLAEKNWAFQSSRLKKKKQKIAKVTRRDKTFPGLAAWDAARAERRRAALSRSDSRAAQSSL